MSCKIRSIYHSKIQSLLKCGIIFFRGGGADKASIFKLQKSIVQIMCGLDTGTSSRQLFKDYIELS